LFFGLYVQPLFATFSFFCLQYVYCPSESLTLCQTALLLVGGKLPTINVSNYSTYSNAEHVCCWATEGAASNSIQRGKVREVARGCYEGISYVGELWRRIIILPLFACWPSLKLNNVLSNSTWPEYLYNSCHSARAFLSVISPLNRLVPLMYPMRGRVADADVRIKLMDVSCWCSAFMRIWHLIVYCGQLNK
jgi:hypothetical protein